MPHQYPHHPYTATDNAYNSPETHSFTPTDQDTHDHLQDFIKKVGTKSQLTNNGIKPTLENKGHQNTLGPNILDNYKILNNSLLASFENEVT